MKHKHLAIAIAGIAAGFGAVTSTAQVIPGEPPPIFPLGAIQPLAPAIQPYVANRTALAQLGKALFWDLNAGSDGQACASCHFHAGADIRLRNQINPGGTDLATQQFDQSFVTANDTTGPNKLQTVGEFPFMQDTQEKNDRMSSQGSFAGLFVSGTQTPAVAAAVGAFRGSNQGGGANTGPGTAAVGDVAVARAIAGVADNCVRTPQPGNPFHTADLMFRRVEPRQTPSVINAAFNMRQFWDGRARADFNGVDPFGPQTNAARPDAGILVAQRAPRGRRGGGGGGVGVALQQVAIANSSLASQAVGPVLSDFEMSCTGRTFADVGRRLISMTPLAEQDVHRQDSLFSRTRGLIPRTAGVKGLATTYDALIRRAFNGTYWNATGRFRINPDGTVVADPNGYTQMEHNFSLFWGLAIQEYELSLVSGDTPFDRGQLTAQEQLGRDVFLNKGLCVDCHSGPMFSTAATARADANPLIPFLPFESMTMGDGRNAIYDVGFYNIGVRPTVEDMGVGGVDPFGNPLSLSRPIVDRNPNDTANRDAVDGAFKTPILRNVGLTPPYMHNGGLASLEQVVEFYDRGGRRVIVGDCDTTGTAPAGATPGTKECSNFDPAVMPLGFTPEEEAGLIAFLKSLTDNRVSCHSGVFDHPSLPLGDGHEPVRDNPNDPNDFTAKDIVRLLPAVGAAGLPGNGLPCFPNSGNLFGEMQTVFEQIAPTPVTVGAAAP